MNCSTRYVTLLGTQFRVHRAAHHLADVPIMVHILLPIILNFLQFVQGYVLSVSLVYLYKKLQSDLFLSTVLFRPSNCMFCQSFSAPSLQRLLCKVAILSWAFWIAAIGCVTEQGVC